ncbi:MAG: hypothetical protein ACJ790_06020 [Myxococcaceae bacterium]
MKRFLAAGLLVSFLVALACGQSDKETNCSDGVDNDKNGLSDCADPACSSTSACSGGDGGAGTACDNQKVCVQSSYVADRPLHQCLNNVCTNVGTAIAVKFQGNTALFNGSTRQFRSWITRFISKKAIDGSAVTCASVAADATGTTAADADQLDRANKYNYLAYDVTPINGLSTQSITNPFLYTALGGDFLIWSELWSQSPNSDTHLPQGLRNGWGCVESGAQVAPIVETDNCPVTDGGSGNCRTIAVDFTHAD